MSEEAPASGQKTFERKIDGPLIFSLIATGLLSFSGVVIETAMNITFPALMEEFGVDTSLVQWMTTGYLLVLSVMIPLSPFLKKRFPRRPLFVLAVLLFMAGAVTDMTGGSFSVLLAGRVLQGIGTGIALPMMFDIVLEQAPVRRMGTMMGAAVLVVALSPAVGPSFGGAVIHYMGWRMIFAFLLPVLGLSLLLGLCSIRQVCKTEKIPFDWGSYLWLAAGFSAFILALSAMGDSQQSPWTALGLYAVSGAALFLFVRRSLRVPAPFIHLDVFRCGPFAGSAAVFGIVQFLCLGLGFLIPNYAQLVMGQNALTAGLIMLPGCMIGAAMAPVGGRFLDLFGARRPILAGHVFLLLCTLGFALSYRHIEPWQMVLFYISFAVGQNLTGANSMVNGIRQLPENRRGDGNSVCNTLQQLSGAAGTAAAAALVASAQTGGAAMMQEQTQAGSGHAFWLLFVLGVMAMGISWNIFRNTGGK